MDKISPHVALEGSGLIRSALFGLFVALPFLALVQHAIIIVWAVME